MDEHCRRRLLQRKLRTAAISTGDLSYLIDATAEYTGAQIEELAKTLYILALGEDNPLQPGRPGEAAACPGSPLEGPSDVDPGPISVTRCPINAALQDVNFQRGARLGFHVA